MHRCLRCILMSWARKFPMSHPYNCRQTWNTTSVNICEIKCSFTSTSLHIPCCRYISMTKQHLLSAEHAHANISMKCAITRINRAIISTWTTPEQKHYNMDIKLITYLKYIISIASDTIFMSILIKLLNWNRKAQDDYEDIKN
jgi:hypothetical protein